jgi:hypothetical protein
MDLAALSIFLPACFALNMAPGSNNLLSVSNATRYGYYRRRFRCRYSPSAPEVYAALGPLSST